jgi:hypothetical protein
MLALCSRGGGIRSSRGSVSQGAAGGAFALLFPKNISGPDVTAPYAALEFANPQTNGLPLWGVSGGGVTVVRKLRVTSPSQQGYYAQFWWCRGDGLFSATDGYWGMHPYPTTQTNLGTTHIWEIAIGGGDYIDFLGNQPGVQTNAIAVAYGSVLKQVMIVTRAGVSSKTLTFYPDATNTASPNFIQRLEVTANYGETNPASPKVIIGDSPWFAGFQHERFGGTLDAIKIITPALSLADAISEVNDFSRMVTSGGQTGIWWGKNGFNSVDDLTCSYGTGRTFTRVDTSNLITTTTRL